LYIIVLVIAGEMVFGLPFHTVRFFRPTILEVFGFTNTQLGYVLGVYGITAMLCYFPGGALADRFPARNLLSLSLFATAAGGVYMATLPGMVAAGMVFGFWGVTTIFLFWGALIRATREWGGQSSQGIAFGILEAGRGITSALFASLAVAVFAIFMPDSGDLVTAADREAGLRAVYLSYSAAALAAGVLVWFAIPKTDSATIERQNPFANMLIVIRKPIVWAQAGVIVCAYCCFRTTDYFAQYAVVVLGMDEVDGSRLASYGAYIRPVALSLLQPGVAATAFIIANMAISLFAVFALRGIYHALLQETRTPRQITGATVGLISVVGYTPDFFFPWLTGVIVDADGGFEGFRNLFILLAVTAAIGVAIVSWLMWLNRRQAGK
jgi:sugar phosphate permease